MKRLCTTVGLMMICGITASLAAVAEDHKDTQQVAADILQAGGVQGGLVVHVNCGDGQLTGAWRD